MNHIISRLLLVLALFAAPAVASLAPGELLVFYGWPGRGMGPCGGCFPEGDNAARRAHEFGVYDDLILGSGLEFDTHFEHELVEDMIRNPAMAGTRVWGYVDIGVTTNDFSIAEITTRANAWKSMGVEGIFLDDYGYDFGTSRARQNTVVDLLHFLGLRVMVNAFDPDDAFSSAVHPTYNPSGAATRLNSNDVYFYESHGVRLGVYESAATWLAKSTKLRSYRASIGFQIYSSTSKGVDDPRNYDEDSFFAAWMLAVIGDHASTGYAEYEYAASGNSNATHAYRPRPTLWPGSAYLGAFARQGSAIVRRTNAGQLYVNTATGTSQVFSSTSTPEVRGATLVLDAPSPNPFNPRTSIGFAVPGSGSAVLSIFDARGRLVLSREVAGNGSFVWDGRDGAGADASSGTYFVRLRSASAEVTRKATLVR